MAKRLLLSLVVGVLFAAGLPVYAQDVTCDQSPSTHRGNGHEYYDAGEYTLAIEQYTCALGADPNDVSSRRLRGSAYGWIGEYNQALEDLNIAIDLDRFDWDAYNRRGIIYEFMGDLDSAITDYTRAIDLGSDSPYIPYYNRGRIYYQLEDYDRALDDFNAALDENPEYSPAFVSRGNTYYSMGDYDQALADYEMSIQYRSVSLEIPYFNLGLTYYNLGDYQQALDDLNQALDYADFGRAYLLRGNVYQTLENPAGYADFARYVDLVRTRTIDWSADDVIATGGMQLSMEDGWVYEMPFTAQAGQQVSATAKVLGNAELDPLLVILDSDGNAVAGDDDSGLNLDAVIRSFTASVTDTYTLLVAHGDGGSYGELNLVLTIGGEAASAPEIYNLYVGNRASVFTSAGDRLNLRSGPGLSFDIVDQLQKGTVVTLLEGPHKAGGYAWWRIQTADGTVGWSVERVEDEQTLQPALEIGEQAVVNTLDDMLNVRSGPGVDFDVIARLERGTVVTVLEGPQPGGDFTWWKIRAEDGVEGWSVERADGERTLVGIPLPKNGE